MTRQLVFDLLLMAICGYAFWRGGAPERIASAVLLVADLLTLLLVSSLSERYRHEEIGIFCVDVAVFLALAAISMRTSRWWPLVLAGLQLDAVASHAVRMAAARTLPIAYWNATALWSYPMLFGLWLGTWRHEQRLRADGTDPGWFWGEAVDEDPPAPQGGTGDEERLA